MVELTQGKEEIMDTRLVSDIEVSSNNGVLAIEPVPEGRLRSLVSITKAGMKRIWLFKGIAPYRDSDGDTRIDHLARGVMTRSFSDGQDFLTMREGIGLKSQILGFFVPFNTPINIPEYFFDIFFTE